MIQTRSRCHQTRRDTACRSVGRRFLNLVAVLCLRPVCSALAEETPSRDVDADSGGEPVYLSTTARESRGSSVEGSYRPWDRQSLNGMGVRELVEETSRALSAQSHKGASMFHGYSVEQAPFRPREVAEDAGNLRGELPPSGVTRNSRAMQLPRRRNGGLGRWRRDEEIDTIPNVGGDPFLSGIVAYEVNGTTPAFMEGDEMRRFLNGLVDISVSKAGNQTFNIAFVKTHKTASTTFATILYRYGKRHELNVANFKHHQTSIGLREAAQQVQKQGERVDLMHYHHAWDGFYDGTWNEAKRLYHSIMRNPESMKFVTVVREPVSHYLSYYYYFLQPELRLSITEYFRVAAQPGDPRYYHAFLKFRGGGAGWHGTKLLYNPLCAEFGIRTPRQLKSFIKDDLPEFSLVLLTEMFEEGLAVFMRMFKWDPIDMTYCRMIETKSGVERYDGKMLSDVPKLSELPPEVLKEIRRQTRLDLTLYKAAVKHYMERKSWFAENLDVDVARIRTVQSAVHGYLDFNATSDAHEWYEGNVHCFDDPSPVRFF